MEILVSNHYLQGAGGTETFTYTLIGELVKRGHKVEYFCLEKGEYSKRIEIDFGVKFKSKNTYDLILANHNTTVNILHKYGLTIQTCHGIFPELEQPSEKAHGYVAISQEVQSKLFGKGLASQLIYNGIDCNRYKPSNLLRVYKPKVLSLCHSQEAHSVVKKACDKLGLEFSILDKYTDNQWEVEKIINENDLVICIGRSAFEAFACGRPVIIFDKRKYAPSLGDGYFLDVITESLKNNCSGRALGKIYTADSLAKEIEKYNSLHGDIARNYALLTFNIERTVDDYIKYADLLRELRIQRTLKARILKSTRKLLIRLPATPKKMIKNIDKFFGSILLKMKRRFIPN